MSYLKNMTISEIAYAIKGDWGNVNFAAKPYLDAMTALDTVSDTYGCDSGASIVRYFLGNAQSYSKRTSKGNLAPADVKKELNARIKGKY
jgi:hypothetical protein